MVSASAFANPIFELDASGCLPERKVFEQWLQDDQVNPLEKVRRIALLLPKSEEQALRSYGQRIGVSWLTNPKEPLLARIGLVFAIAVVVIAACFAVAPPLGLYWGSVGLLAGSAALFADLLKPTVAQIEEEKQQQLESWAELVQAIGGIQKYYEIPVLPNKNFLQWPPFPKDLPHPIVKGLDVLDQPFIIFKLQSKTSDHTQFSIVFTMKNRPSRLYYRTTTPNFLFEKWSEIYRAPIPRKDKERYSQKFPKPELSKDFLNVFKSTFPHTIHHSKEELFATLSQIVVMKDHPHFELVENANLE